jgi:hypothetical protein
MTRESLFWPTCNACFLPCLNLHERFPLRLYKPRGNFADSHLHSSAIALGSFSHAFAPLHSCCPTLVTTSLISRAVSWHAVVRLNKLKGRLPHVALAEATPTGGGGEVLAVSDGKGHF